MKRVALLIAFLYVGLNTYAQETCMPAEGLPDTLVGVVPVPYDPEAFPDGGINDTACVGSYFEFTFTVVVPAEFNSPVGPVPLDSITFATEGAITGMPSAYDYVCNPPNCTFLKDSIGCVKIFGTTTNEADAQVWDLMLTGKIHSVLDFDLTFPNETIAPGNYFLTVRPSDDPNCIIDNTEEALATKVSISNAPNPFSGQTQIFINSDVTEQFTFQVHDLLGKQLHQQTYQIFEGENTIDFDGSSLPNGVYIYSINNGEESVSKKMIVNRQ